MPGEGRVSIPAGMLSDEHRQLLIVSISEELPVVVASLHGCVLSDRAVLPECKEPWHGQGLVATWDEDAFVLARDDDTVSIPWRSAVWVWRPDLDPGPEERLSIIRMYSYGSRPAPHT